MNQKTRTIAFMAVMTAIGVVLNVFSYPSVTYFGRMSLVYAFCFLSGIWFGPVKGFIIAVLADILQVLIFPQAGVYVPQITISNGLLAAIIGLMMKIKSIKFVSVKVIIGSIICLIVCSAGMSAWGEAMFLFNVYPYKLARLLGATYHINSPYLMIAFSKLITQSFWIAINVAITLFIYKSLKTIIIISDKKLKKPQNDNIVSQDSTSSKDEINKQNIA